MAFKDSPAQNVSIEALRGTEKTPQRYGYRSDGTKKRILLNAFDMNGIGHIRYFWSRNDQVCTDNGEAQGSGGIR